MDKKTIGALAAMVDSGNPTLVAAAGEYLVAQFMNGTPTRIQRKARVFWRPEMREEAEKLRDKG